MSSEEALRLDELKTLFPGANEVGIRAHEMA
jgi:hypothetical protein